MSGHHLMDTITAPVSNENNDDFGIHNYQTATATTTGTSNSLNCGNACPGHFYPPAGFSYDSLTPEQREMLKKRYYQSYDVMTGLKTAASLGGTILLFSLFILYKMKCRHRHGKHHPVIQTSPSRTNDTDIEKDGGGFANGNPPLINDNKTPNFIAINNVGGSRRSSKVVLAPEDFQNLSRNESRLSSLTTTSSRHNGSRMSCGTILPFHNLMSAGDTLPSGFSIASASPCAVSPLIPLSRILTPRFITNEERDPTFNLLRPDLACCAEPINIQIIQPTPNVSPCGSIRRLSEDAGALMESRHRDNSSVSIPLLTLPKPHISKIKCKSKKLHRESAVRRDSLSPDSDYDGKLSCLTLNASTISASRRSKNTSSDGHDCTLDIKFIDCSDSDAVSFSSDSEACFSGLDSDTASPPSPSAGSCNFVHDSLPVLQPTELALVDSQLDSHNANQTDEESNVSETTC